MSVKKENNHLKGICHPNWKGGKPPCIDCGKELVNRHAKRCKTCQGKYYSKNRVGSNHPNWKGGKPHCIDCGKKVAYDSKRCVSCAGKLLRKVNHPNWKGGPNHCLDCGKELNNRKKKRCRECSLKYRIGPNSPSWKGGITSLYNKVRLSFKYKQYRTKVYERDHYKSVLSKKGGKLEAHHIYPFNKLLQEAVRIYPNLSPFEAAMQYTPLWNIDNMVTLTKKEHDEVGKIAPWLVTKKVKN